MKKNKTFFIKTFGCQMNFSDSERISAILSEVNIIETSKIENADFIIINTCSVRQKAEDKINGFINNIKKINLNSKIIITGCIARRVWDDTKSVSGSVQKSSTERNKELKAMFPKADFFIETKLFNFGSTDLVNFFKSEGIAIDKKKSLFEHYLSFKPKYKSKFQAYVPISTGCNHFCTFCIVPYSRGKEILRNASEIIREVFELISRGYKDITLLGQTVNRWINPLFLSHFVYKESLTRIEGLNSELMDNNELKKWKFFFNKKLKNSQFNYELTMPRDFLQLVQVLDQIPGDWWFTFYSSHPNYMTYQLIDYIGYSVKNSWFNGSKRIKTHLRPFLHFALQSGSNKILKKMNRRYTIEEFNKIVERIYKKVPNISLSTDVIVGFHEENENDFLETIKAQEVNKFDMIYISEYSRRPATAAYNLVDNVDLKTKKARKYQLNEILKKIAFEKNKSLNQKIVTVLPEKIYSNYFLGKTESNKDIRVKISEKVPSSEFVKAKVTSFSSFSLEGEIFY